MNDLNMITSPYKKQFIDDIVNCVESFLDNNQLMELNKSLNKHTNGLTISENNENLDPDYEKTNEILIKEFIK